MTAVNTTACNDGCIPAISIAEMLAAPERGELYAALCGWSSVPRVVLDLALAARSAADDSVVVPVWPVWRCAVNKREIEDAGLGTPIKRTGRRLNRGRRGSLGVLREPGNL